VCLSVYEAGAGKEVQRSCFWEFRSGAVLGKSKVHAPGPGVPACRGLANHLWESVYSQEDRVSSGATNVRPVCHCFCLTRPD